MRSAIRQQRAAKQPGDGLLHRLQCDDGGTKADTGSSQSVAEKGSTSEVEVSSITVARGLSLCMCAS